MMMHGIGKTKSMAHNAAEKAKLGVVREQLTTRDFHAILSQAQGVSTFAAFELTRLMEEVRSYAVEESRAGRWMFQSCLT